MSSAGIFAAFFLMVMLLGSIPSSAFGALAPSSAPVGVTPNGGSQILLANGTAVSTNDFYWNTFHLNNCQVGGTFVEAIPYDPTGLSGLQSGFSEQNTDPAMYEMLVRVSANETLQPDLAESWTLSPNGTVYTFNLVHNATWTDGVPVTAQDVYFTYSQLGPKLNALYGLVAPYVNHWNLVNNYTVQLVLNHPTPSFFWTFDRPNIGYVLPMHVFVANGWNKGNFSIPVAQNTNPVTDGPFMLSQWVHGDHLTFVRNPHFFRAGLPVLNQVIFKIIPDTTSMYNALLAGEVDGIFSSTLANEIQIKGSPGITQTVSTSTLKAPGFSYFQFNLRRPLLNNSLVRQGLAYTIPYNQIRSTVYLNQSLPAGNGPFPPGSYAYTPAAIAYNLNLTKAAQLFDQAGYKVQANGSRFSLSFTYITSAPANGNVGQLWAQELKQVGVTLTLNPVATVAFLSQIVNGPYNFDVFADGGSAGPDYAAGVLRFYTIAGQSPPGEYKDSNDYSNPKIEALATQVYAAPTIAQAGQLLGQIEVIAQQDAATIPYIGPSNSTISYQSHDLNWKHTILWDSYPDWGLVCFAAAASTVTTASTASTASTVATVSPAGSSTGSAVASSSTGLSNSTLLGIAAVVVIAVAIGAVVMRRRMGKPAASTAASSSST